MPNTTTRVGIELYLDDSGALRLREVLDETEAGFRDVETSGTGAASRIKSSWATLKGAWVEVTAGIMAVREAWDLMNTAAKAQQEKAAFASLAQSYGTNANAILSSLRDASNGTISTMDLVRQAGTAMMMGLAPEDVTRLMNVAAATAKMTGQDVSQAFEDITLASARESKMILDNLGIMVDLETANAAYAESLGVTADQLTDTQRKQAFMTAALKEGGAIIDKLGGQANTAADKFQRFTATVENLRVGVGSGLLRVFYFLEGTLQSVAAASLAVSGGIFRLIEASAALTDKLHLTSGAAEQWKINSEAAFGAADALAMKADQSFSDMKSSNDAVIQGQVAMKKTFEDTTKAIDAQAEATKKVVDQAKSDAEKQQAATEDMYKEAGIGADMYFQSESNKLIKRASDWKQAGADSMQVEEWLYDQLGKLASDAWSKGETAAGQYMDSLQSQSRTLVDEFALLQTTATERLTAMGVQISDLDGSHINLTASFDGTGVIAGIDELMLKLQSMQAAASSAVASVSMSGGAAPQAAGAPSNQTNQSGPAAGNTSQQTNIYVNQQMSRSDVNAIASEQRRMGARS